MDVSARFAHGVGSLAGQRHPKIFTRRDMRRRVDAVCDLWSGLKKKGRSLARAARVPKNLA